MEPTPIPLSFVQNRLVLTWPDVAWGFQNGWLDAASVVDHAVSQLAENEAASSPMIDLAGLTRSELTEVPFLLERIVTKAAESSVTSQRKWLYLTLAWFYENRAELEDPLGVVEQLYADFDYPTEISSFVRFMPPAGDYEPRAHSHAENVDRLFRKWKSYLDDFSTRA